MVCPGANVASAEPELLTSRVQLKEFPRVTLPLTSLPLVMVRSGKPLFRTVLLTVFEFTLLTVAVAVLVT